MQQARQNFCCMNVQMKNSLRFFAIKTEVFVNGAVLWLFFFQIP